MSKSSGMIVKTSTGQRGTTKNCDDLVNGKIIVYLEEDGKPVLDEKQEQKKMLCDPKTLTGIGFTD